ncbi:conserved Plasmodium protein, unknown function [Plasmodium reichenowi]|uniref:Mitochondrial import receptor subunit TOM7, putative n=14 Tax=Plasmodium (Laverania) TaxID=418107 RepID=Q8IB71_PLAF7|nr:mitochondrial import receptor subunit TOM7, putative [Plasmodium falciparum 3D7]XP_012762623.1 hypothetical protein PRSY57_0823000 [Plasmodium reichenowi]XP_018642329.1 hypothetical protein PGSY75_0823700 [Plasmodium gaboni]XP_028537943.1 conserved Plasmodium protein, unknown function [Plasmodium sp. gorilla clade G2]ETW36952.1 hypothetical protein PFTANZ_02251 [Plasmodium falciparum Tanzania (2000708)]ETW43388.1 hypothetical protein PFNF135_02300 [Plasmodium falciparum NF135/5.C10]ETW5242|eukprot:XP_001349287.1 conserved Plasmodium protein, unknown function [Plasmodium falciparum 3D7]
MKEYHISIDTKKIFDRAYAISLKMCDKFIRPFLYYGFTPMIFGYGLYYNNEFTLNPFKLIPKILIG